ncbi:uracil-DNA glycosylase [Candidatus Kaiserbacteria bacterium]|nr:MAG: uracil-DNA glycosylase [Candidatus Kaiserbacteria bacterium]
MNISVLSKGWQKHLAEESSESYYKELTAFVNSEYSNAEVYPDEENIFRSLDLCPFEKVKVVILGQDPYHGDGQANGLCFAVNENVKSPPSLRNIFKELEGDLGKEVEKTGDLERWAKQGVLLLNATLTVRASKPGSHQKKGWEEFTDKVIQKLSDERKGLVFILWGNYAKEKGKNIDVKKHLVLSAPHPSPFSAHSGFFGCKHFSKTNEYLKTRGKKEIDW